MASSWWTRVTPRVLAVLARHASGRRPRVCTSRPSRSRVRRSLEYRFRCSCRTYAKRNHLQRWPAEVDRQHQGPEVANSRSR